VAQLVGDVVAQLPKTTGCARLKTQQTRVRIRLSSQSPERGQEI
jgi:hypothetical protein